MTRIGRKPNVSAVGGQTGLHRVASQRQGDEEKVRRLGKVAAFSVKPFLTGGCGMVSDTVTRRTVTVVFPRVEALRRLGVDLDGIYGKGNWRRCEHGGIVLGKRVDSMSSWGKLEGEVSRRAGLTIRPAVVNIWPFQRKLTGSCDGEIFLVVSVDARRVPNPDADDI